MRHTCYNCYYGGDGEELDDYGHCWKHNGEVDFDQPDKDDGCEEWARKLFCQEQVACVDSSVYCLAHLAEARVLDCPYESREDRLKSDYPCQDYRERTR